MKVFISWSGEPSRQVALALRDWLPIVIQAVKPYMSEQDNEAGVRWLDSVSTELDGTHFGVICVAPNNIDSRWLNFEAGALSKTVDRARVVPLLYGFDSLSDMVPPLSQFQAKLANVSGIRDLMTSINEQMDDSLAPNVLAESFELAWPKLKTALDLIANSPSSTESPQRSPRELLEEILELSRGSQVILRGIRVEALGATESTLYRERKRDIGEVFKLLGGRVEYSENHISVYGLSPENIELGEYERLRVRAERLGMELKFYPDEPPF